MNKLIFLLVFSIATAAQPTPPQPQTADWSGVTYYQTDAAIMDKKPKPPIPEPSTYGAIFIAISAAAVGWRKWGK